jgi:hypothetical protein
MTIKKITIPLSDMCIMATGFYIGYAEGKGIEKSVAVEYATKYAPTLFVMAIAPLTIRMIQKTRRNTNRKVREALDDGSLEIKLENGTKVRYQDLSPDDKQLMYSRANCELRGLDYLIRDQKYLVPTVLSGARAAADTLIGYGAGRLCSQIF